MGVGREEVSLSVTRTLARTSKLSGFFEIALGFLIIKVNQSSGNGRESGDLNLNPVSEILEPTNRPTSSRRLNSAVGYLSFLDMELITSLIFSLMAPSVDILTRNSPRRASPVSVR